MTEQKIKHPTGLKYLFFTEMWERFGYYLMLGILFLYMTDTAKGGLGFERKEASDVFGTFIALVFLTPFIGGLLADRVLGYRTSITIGGILMGIGYMSLAIPGQTMFYVSLMLIIVGNGFFKPNISTLLGNLYNEPKYKQKKDAGYNIFYMGINVGAFVCNFFAAYLRNTFGWGHAFMAAGIGMLLGVAIFWIGNKHYRHADVRKPANPEDMGLGKVFGVVLLPHYTQDIWVGLFPGIFWLRFDGCIHLWCLTGCNFLYHFIIETQCNGSQTGFRIAGNFWCCYCFLGDLQTEWNRPHNLG